MKLFVISDIHGSLYYLKKVMEIFEKEKYDKILILGDELYHGPRNPLPRDYSPKEVIEILNKYKDKIRAAHQDEPQFGAQSTPLDERTERLILALVFAAKSDGHIDAKERAAIDQQLREAGVEEQGRVLIEQAIEQPLDPQRLATGVRNEEEALEIYFLSCAAIDIDHFMERSYLNALGDALKIPQDVRDGIERDLEQQKRTLAE